MSASILKPGDLVMCVNNRKDGSNFDGFLKAGYIYTIREIDGVNGSVLVDGVNRTFSHTRIIALKHFLIKENIP
jgi:hypothetical protein